MSIPKTSKVIIAGGGIAGVACALALAKKGAQVVLFERSTDFGELGAGLQIGPHGSRILRSWEVLDELLLTAVQPDALVFRDAVTAEELTRIDLGRDFKNRYGGPYFVTHRKDLHAVLTRAARDAGAELHAGVTVRDLRTEGDSVVVDTDILGSHTADVAVGVDGLNSRLRSKISDDKPVPSGYVAYRGAVPTSSVDFEVDVDNVVGYIGPRCHFIRYPVQNGKVLNQVAVFQYTSSATATGDPEASDPEDAFAHCHPEVRAGIPHLWTDRWWPMYDRDPIEDWVHGRMILLGDAAHPPLQYLASGAVMALEDAHCLAEYADRLFAAPLAPAEAWPRILKAVNVTRAARCNQVIIKGRMWGQLWHFDGAARLVRNELFRVRDTRSYKYTDWLWGSDDLTGVISMGSQ